MWTCVFVAMVFCHGVIVTVDLHLNIFNELNFVIIFITSGHKCNFMRMYTNRILKHVTRFITI